MSDEVKWNRGHWENGQLMWEIPLVNGQVHGIQREWHPNGQLYCETPLVNGRIHGITKFWVSDGKLWSIEKWHQGQKVIGLKLDHIPDDATMELDLITNILTYD